MAGRVSTLFDHSDREVVYRNTREITRRVKPTEPVYLFSRGSLRRKARCFQRGFPGIVSYAVKANPETRVVQALLDQGIRHFDVASIGEVESVAALCPGARLHFNNPVKAIEAIQMAYRRFGVRSFALDEAAEFEKISRATNNARDVMYSVRFKLSHAGASYDFGSKFGTSPENAAAILKSIAAAGARPALTFHPGSQCTDPQMYFNYLEAAAQIIKTSGVEVEQINVGGGFPEHYENTEAPALERYFQAIEQAANTLFERRPTLMCEPGRGMVAASVSLLVRIIHVREDGRTVFVNDGVYGGMQEQSIVDYSLPVKIWRKGRELRGETVSCHVFGPTCDPIDRLSREIDLPAHVQAGDYIEFGLLGAYGSATSTGFNGFQSRAYFNVVNGFRSL